MEKSKEMTKEKYYAKKPTFGEESGFKIREHFKKGTTAFLVVVACIVCYFAILRFDYIAELSGEIISIIQPIIYGLVLAYLLNPIVKIVEKYVKIFLGHFIKNEKFIHKTGRSIGIFSSLIFAIAVVSALINMLLPELIESIMDLVEKLPSQMESLFKTISTFQRGDKQLNQFVQDLLLQASDALETWVKTNLFEKTNMLMASVTSGVISVVSGVLDVVVGIIVSIYVLYSKEQFQAQCRKLIYAILPAKRANVTLHIMHKSNEIFGGFIIGKIIDSAIIGVLCFIGVSLLDMPYALLVSVFVGVTNVIPYFGPFIGAIPSAILIMIVDPIKGLYFIIFILLLQQLDGNIIGPTILGDSTGLSAFWVVFAILVGGGLFGIFGMIVGVPTFAVLYYIAELFITQRLEKKNLPTATACYDEMSYVDDEGNYVKVQEEMKEEKGE